MVKDNVILIAGDKRVGKDTVADMLLAKINKSNRVAYADPMKDMVANMLGITVEELEKLKNDETKPHRGYLQRFGQRAKRYFGENCWGDYAEFIIANSPKGSVSVISDFRMPIEYVEGALTIKILDRRKQNKDTHISENALGDFEFDITIYNEGSLEDLEKEVDSLVKRLYKSEWLT